MDKADAAISPESAIAACRNDLAANVRPEDVMKRLREIEATANSDGGLRAQWLVAKGIATNRLGFRGEALGDLNEAADLFAGLNDNLRLAEAKREAAVVHSWRGEGREAGLALLRAVAESLAAKDMTGVAVALIEAGRLEIEMGRPHAAAPLFDRALKLEGADLPPLQRRRAEVNQLQALVAAGQVADALQFRQMIAADLVSATPRLHLLTAIEEIRCACAEGRFEEARQQINAARALMPDRESFEAIELAQAEAELAVATRDFALAAAKLQAVIGCFADQDLAGREVSARLLHAKALEGLGRRDEAERMLSTALRVAVMRGLIGHADQVRSALAMSGGCETMMDLNSLALGPKAQDMARRFVRRKPLGGGGQGSVFRAYDLELGGEVALKRVNLAALYDVSQREIAIETARTEVAAASRIDHPGVARTRGLIIEPGGDAVLIEDLIDGPSLRSLIAGGGIEPAQALDLIARIAFALSAIHAAKIVHCDLKPENIMLAGPGRPVIIDFGIALLDMGRRSRCGTPDYMAPEQKRGVRIDGRTDLFALGIIGLELMGIPPKAAHSFWVPFGKNDDSITKVLRAAGISPQCVKLMRSLVAPAKFMRPHSSALVGQIVTASSSASS